MVELEAKFFEFNNWSFTRHRVWNKCRRQYYFEYIASYLKPPTSVDANKVKQLKNYNSRFVLQGQLIHDILNDQIQLHCEEKPMDPLGAILLYSKRIAQNRIMASEIFTEYRHGEQVDEDFFTSIEESGRACLNEFFENLWPEYKKRKCLRHEEFDKFSIGSVNAVVKVDFVSALQDGTIVLTDWKTGLDEGSYDTELQLKAYVLWAMQYYSKLPIEIQSELVFLKTGVKKSYSFSEKQLQDVRETIRTDSETMNVSYEFDDFPPRRFFRECLSCRFMKVCP